MTALTLFPSRIRFVNADGTLTPEAVRMLEVLVTRVGGTLGDVGTDVFASPDARDEIAGWDLVQVPQHAPAEFPPIVQPSPVAPALPEMIFQQSAEQVDGTNFTGSFTGKTVTVINGIITSVV